MPHDFRCATDAGFQVIFDAGAVKDVAEPQERFEAAVKAGRIATRALGDGEALFRVFLEGEAVPRSMAKRAGPAVKGLLEVPTGQVGFSGLEAMASAQTLAVPPGRYEITLHEMAWSELVEALAERAGRRTSASGSKVGEVLGTVAGGLVLVTGIGGIAALVAVLRDGWSAWSAAWPWVLGAAGVLGVIALVGRAWPGAREALAARQAMRERFPTTLVLLRRLADGEGPRTGAVLGEDG